MWKIIPLLLCLATPAWADSDPWGNVYPAECQDVSGITVQTIVVSKLPVMLHSESRCGAWLQRPQGSIIYVLKTCSYPRAEVVKHELTHECMNRLHGDPRWHQ